MKLRLVALPAVENDRTPSLTDEFTLVDVFNSNCSSYENAKCAWQSQYIRSQCQALSRWENTQGLRLSKTLPISYQQAIDNVIRGLPKSIGIGLRYALADMLTQWIDSK